MPPSIFQTRVVKNQALTADVYEMDCELVEPTDLEFQAGQFVMIQMTDDEGKPLNRAYSIASSPQNTKQITLCYKVVAGGKMTPRLAALEVGAALSMRGPMGHFVLKAEADTQEFVFVATGTGVAPMNSFIVELLERGEQRPISLFFCVRSEADSFYIDFYKQLESQYPNFKFIFSLSQPHPDWNGCIGRVTHMIEDHLSSAEHSECYLCGNGEMIKEVKELLIKKGAENGKVYMERYY